MHILKLEWDEEKRLRTRDGRGIDFADAARFDWRSAVIEPDMRRDYGEKRMRAFGNLDGRLHTLVFTMRADALRVISLRRANEREQRRWRKRSES